MAKKLEIATIIFWVIGIAVVLSYTGIGNKLFLSNTQSVADVEGKACTNSTMSTACGNCFDEKGIGVMKCTEGKCDATWCVSYEPVETWLIANPWQWIKDNILIVAAIIAVIIFGYVAFGKKN